MLFEYPAHVVLEDGAEDTARYSAEDTARCSALAGYDRLLGVRLRCLVFSDKTLQVFRQAHQICHF